MLSSKKTKGNLFITSYRKKKKSLQINWYYSFGNGYRMSSDDSTPFLIKFFEVSGLLGPFCSTQQYFFFSGSLSFNGIIFLKQETPLPLGFQQINSITSYITKIK